MTTATNEVAQRLAHRNREIGTLLVQARAQQRRSVRTCAAVLGTSRRRYSAIERGEIGITIGELELLADFLALSVADVLRGAPSTRGDDRRVIRVRPGEQLQVEVVG